MFSTKIVSRVQLSHSPIDPSTVNGLQNACAKLMDVCKGSNLLRTPDSKYIQGIYVSSGSNLNNDFFLPSELAKAFHSCMMKPIDIEHEVEESTSFVEAVKGPFSFGYGKNTIIGAIYDSVFVDAISGSMIFAKDYQNTLSENYAKTSAVDGLVIENPLTQNVRYDIVIAGILWNFLFPKTVAQVIDSIQNGNMALSMEVYFTNYDWLVGGQLFSANEAPHLAEAFKKKQTINGHSVHRVLRNITFGGVGAVASPGNQNAFDFIEVAASKEVYAKSRASLINECKQEQSGGTSMNLIDPNTLELLTQVRDVDALKSKASDLSNTVDELRRMLDAKDVVLAKTVDERDAARAEKTELEKQVAAIETLKKENEELASKVSETTAKIEELSTSLAAYETANKIAARLVTLREKDLLIEEAGDAQAVASLDDVGFDNLLKERERVIASVKAKLESNISRVADPIASVEKQVLDTMSTTASVTPVKSARPAVSPFAQI